MHRKIQDLAYARFQHEKPEVECSIEQLEIQLFYEDVYHGKFSFGSTNGRNIRGRICSSDSHLKCSVKDFDGIKVEVPFEFQSAGLCEGEVQKGEITIIYNGGEYSLPFVVSIIPFYIATSVGKIDDLNGFARLAKESWEEAYGIFRDISFTKLIGKKQEKEYVMYLALGGRKASMQGMEEFLIGIGSKQEILFSVEDTKKTYANVKEDIRESISVKKDQWGYLDLSITSDSNAVEPVKKHITTADFVGKCADVEFVIHVDKLHSGKNYAQITIESLKQRESCVLCIESRQKEKRGVLALKKRLLTKVGRLYLDFRMKRMITGVWSRETCICMERLRELEPENLWYVLYQAQALIINKQRQEADWLLDRFRRKAVKNDSPLYAYYLYICILRENEPSFVTKTFRQIQKIYHKNQDHIWLFLIMLFLDPEWNQSKSRKLSAIEEKVTMGVHSPILYMEAYYLIQHDVYLLQRPGDFERKVLHWAAKEGMLTKSVAGKICQSILQVRSYTNQWYEILVACYQAEPQKEILQSICSFCIKWNLYSDEQFIWFDKGIRQELRIAGLYEAWLASAGAEQIRQFPRNVMLYFQYQKNLTGKKQALLYAGIVKHKENQKGLYDTYRKNMEYFAIQQILAGRIDENLAVLYQDMLMTSSLNEEVSEKLAKVRNTYKLICRDFDAARVIIPGKVEQASPLLNGQAYVQLSFETDCILLENAGGIRYVPAKTILLKRLFPTDEIDWRNSDYDDKQVEELQDISQSSACGQLLWAEQEIEKAQEECDIQLVTICNRIFEQGIYNESILRYLCHHYKGSTQRMETLWLAASRFDVDTYELEERLLAQILYTEGYTAEMEKVFKSYFDARGQELILMACLSYFSYLYFVKNMAIDDSIFQCIRQQIELGNALNDCCRLAYFKWLVCQEDYTENQEKQLEMLLQEYVKKQMYFSFYEKLPQKLLKKYLLHDKVILEYRGNPSHKICIRYCCMDTDRRNGETEEESLPDALFWREQEMPHMYEGIFAKLFVVFCGEEIRYEVTEETEGLVTSQRGVVQGAVNQNQKENHAYAWINQMQITYQTGDMETLQQLYHQYQQKKQMTEELFQLL